MHIAAGGSDSGKIGRAPSTSAANPSGDLPNPDSGAGQGTSGGHPYLLYMNHKVMVQKRLFYKGRSMSPAEQMELEEKCRLEWIRMDEDHKQIWGHDLEAQGGADRRGWEDQCSTG